MHHPKIRAEILFTIPGHVLVYSKTETNLAIFMYGTNFWARSARIEVVMHLRRSLPEMVLRVSKS